MAHVSGQFQRVVQCLKMEGTVDQTLHPPQFGWGEGLYIAEKVIISTKVSHWKSVFDSSPDQLAATAFFAFPSTQLAGKQVEETQENPDELLSWVSVSKSIKALSLVVCEAQEEVVNESKETLGSLLAILFLNSNSTRCHGITHGIWNQTILSLNPCYTIYNLHDLVLINLLLLQFLKL